MSGINIRLGIHTSDERTGVSETFTAEINIGGNEGSSSRLLDSDRFGSDRFRSNRFPALESPDSPNFSEFDSPIFSRRSPSPPFTRLRLRSPVRYEVRSPSPPRTRRCSPSPPAIAWRSTRGTGNGLLRSFSSSSRRRSPSPPVTQRRHSPAPSMLSRSGSLFGSCSREETGIRSSARDTEQSSRSRGRSPPPSSSSRITGNHGSTYTSHHDTSRTHRSAAPGSSAHGSAHGSGHSPSHATSRSTAHGSTSSRANHETERSNYYIPGQSSSHARSSSRPATSHATSSSSRTQAHSRSGHHDTSSRDTLRATSRTDSRSTSGTARQHSTRDTSRSTAKPDTRSTSGTAHHQSSRDTSRTTSRNTDRGTDHHQSSRDTSRNTSRTTDRGTSNTSRYGSSRSTQSPGPENSAKNLGSAFDSYDGKWKKLGRIDKKYPLPAPSRDLYKIDFSGGSARARNYSSEDIFVANVQLIYLAGFGISATLNDRGDTLRLDINKDGTSEKIKDLTKWLRLTEQPR
ncbi:hypothetical protein Q7P37_002320 [Cladosporium fusiforme]